MRADRCDSQIVQRFNEKGERPGALAKGGAYVPATIADSLVEAKSGQLLCLDDRGGVVGIQSSYPRRMKALGLGIVGGLLIATVGLGMAAPVVFGTLGVAMWFFRVARKMSAVRPAEEAYGANRNDEAFDLATALLQRRLLKEVRLRALTIRMTSSLRLGRFDMCLSDAGEITRLLNTSRRNLLIRSQRNVLHWITEFVRAQALTLTGAFGLAREILERSNKVPHGDYLQLAHDYTELSLAFHCGDRSRLPEDLHRQVQFALRSNIFGSSLVLLAWEHRERGENEMFEHLIGESQSRMGHACIEQSDPTLHRWMIGALSSVGPGPAQSNEVTD